MFRKLCGRGTLLLDDVGVLAGEFEISHDLNQSNGLAVSFKVTGDEATAFSARFDTDDREDLERQLALGGATNDSIPVKIDQLLIGHRTLSRKPGQPMQIVLTLFPRASLAIGALPKGASAFQFLCPNLLFNGAMSTVQVDGGYKMDTVLVETEHDDKTVRFTLKQLPDYEEAAATVQQTTKSRWTATLGVETTYGSALEVEEVSSLADDFLLLLSFALSRRATWVSLETSDDSGSFQRIRSGTATNLKSFPGSVMGNGNLIAGEKGFARHPLSKFMETALPAFWALEKDKQECLREAIECMCESIQRFFSPATITLAGRAFESLCKGFLDRHKQSYLSENHQEHVDLRAVMNDKLGEFGDLWANIEERPAEEWRERLDGHVSNLLRRPFKLQLESLLEKHLVRTGNPHDSSWGKQFVNARNHAAHPYPVGHKEVISWVKGITLLSQVILKILGYRGPYVSFYGDGTSESKWSTLN